MKVYVGADHNGFHMREGLVKHLKEQDYDVVDDGDTRLDPEDDFPLFAQKVVNDMLSGDDPDPRGILICGSGQGMCMAANRFKGIRAAMLYDMESARSSRNDDDSNVACIAARVLKKDEANRIIDTWLKTDFAKAPRFIRRNHELDTIG